MKRLVCTVLALVFVGAVAIGGGDQAVYATSSPTLDAIVAGSATPVELGHPMWWSWTKFFAVIGGVAAVANAVAAVFFADEAAGQGATGGGSLPYSGVSEAIFN